MAEEAENTDTTQETTQESGKTFTQADVDRIVADRLARERKNQPSAERMKAFEVQWEFDMDQVYEFGFCHRGFQLK